MYMYNVHVYVLLHACMHAYGVKVVHVQYMYSRSYGFHPRSEGLTNNMPALDTVAGVAALRCPISNISLIEGVRGTLSLLASVNTYTV